MKVNTAYILGISMILWIRLMRNAFAHSELPVAFFVVEYPLNNFFAKSMAIYSLEMESHSGRPKLLN